jgi:hypothetical protein
VGSKLLSDEIIGPGRLPRSSLNPPGHIVVFATSELPGRQSNRGKAQYGALLAALAWIARTSS